MKCTLNALIFSLVCLPLIAQMQAPKIGVARYADGSLSTVQGLSSNIIVSDLPLNFAQAASFSDQGGLVSQNGVIRLLGKNFSPVAEYTAAEKPLLGMEGELTSALAWLPVAHILLHWNGSRFEALGIWGVETEGTVTDVRFASARQAMLIVQHADNSVSSVTISLHTGSLVNSETIPGVRGYTFGLGHFLIFTSDRELIADDLKGYRRSLPFTATDFVVERMSSTWLHLYSPSLRQHWALHLTQSDFQLSVLPNLPKGTSSVSVAAIGTKENK